MKAESIRTHLKPPKISGRTSTLTSVFAGAMAPSGTYDRRIVVKAMRELKQNPKDLACVFCGRPATDWDHLFPIVKGKTFSGYGHWLGNLVPSCGSCNQSKRGLYWADYLKSKTPSRRSYETKRRRLASHFRKYGGQQIAPRRIQQLCGDDIRKLDRLRETIFAKMKRADEIAIIVHEKLQKEERRLKRRRG